MGKRKGEEAGIDMQVQKHNYDSNRVAKGPPPASGMAASSSSSFTSRVIRKGKRKSTGAKTNGSSSGGMFAGVNLSSSNGTKPAGNPFQGINLLGSSSGGGMGGSSSATSTSMFGSGTSIDAKISSSNGTSSATASAGSSKSEQVLKNTAALNKSFCKWVDAEMGKGGSEPLTDGVLGYIKYAKEQAEKFGADASMSSGSSSATSMFPSSSVNSTSTDKKPDGSSKMMFGDASSSGADGLFAYGSSSGDASALFSGSLGKDSPAGKSTGGESSSKSGLFNSAGASGGGLFGSGSGATTSSGGLFGSSGSAAPAGGLFGSSGSTPAGGLFGGAGSSGGSSFLNGSSNGVKAEEDGDEDTDPSEKEETVQVEDNVRDDETLVHKVRAKVNYLKNNEWASKGLGDLSVLQEKATKNLYLVLRSETGRITANIPVSKSTDIKVNEKGKAVTFAAVSYAEDESGNAVAENDGKPTGFMIRVKTLDMANTLSQKN
mmetsp:Transcript_19006/g.31671  ORF Transcript_19006/g.31671 Transcript_19006/m.31671 type:complete len:489 (+) Transcript_19006:74-1540(+)